MFCHNCGKEVDNNSKKCPYCGVDLIHNDSAPVPIQRKKKSHKPFLLILLAVILVCIFLLIKNYIAVDHVAPNEELTEDFGDTEDVIPSKGSEVIDVEPYMNEPVDKLLKMDDFRLAIGAVYETSDEMVTVEADEELITRISIYETSDYSFHQISYGMDYNTAQQLLAADYQYDVRKEDVICFWKAPYYEVGGYIYLDDNNNCERIEVMTDFQQELVPYKYDRGYIIFDSVYRELTEEDVENMDSYQLERALDEIYARAGMRFADLEKLEYFSKTDWYEGTINEEEFSDSDLTEVEKYNIDFLTQKIKSQKEVEGMGSENFIGVYKNEEIDSTIKIMLEDEDSDAICFEIYEGDSLYVQVTDAEIEENYVYGDDYILTKNTDGSITLQIDGGGVIGDFVKE